MILIDPDLDPDPTPSPIAAKPLAGSVSASKFRNLCLPSTRALARFLVEAQAAVRLRGHVTVLLTTDDALRGLNRRFRSKNKPTDVLSFPAENLLKSQEKIAGDLAISVDTARRQGSACGHPLGTELKILMLHGLLHLAGYDHESDAGQMQRRERILRSRLGLPLGLIERTAMRGKNP
jgi:probable rRNA maturation factor